MALTGKEYSLKFLIMVLVGFFSLSEAQPVADPMLEKNCLECHREQRLPDNLIYRRYLLKYSSTDRIEKALTAYLKHPSQQTSIMPAEFFLRFPMRDPIELNDQVLRQSVQQYIDFFDVRKRLQLEDEN